MICGAWPAATPNLIKIISRNSPNRLTLFDGPAYAQVDYGSTWGVHMRSALLFIWVMLFPLASQSASAQNAVYTVTYIEVLPSAKADAAVLVKEYAEASRRQEGTVRLEALQRTDRTNHFA